MSNRKAALCNDQESGVEEFMKVGVDEYVAERVVEFNHLDAESLYKKLGSLHAKSSSVIDRFRDDVREMAALVVLAEARGVEVPDNSVSRMLVSVGHGGMDPDDVMVFVRLWDLAESLDWDMNVPAEFEELAVESE